jgi:hypothetical protein
MGGNIGCNGLPLVADEGMDSLAASSVPTRQQFATQNPEGRLACSFLCPAGSKEISQRVSVARQGCVEANRKANAKTLAEDISKGHPPHVPMRTWPSVTLETAMHRMLLCTAHALASAVGAMPGG